MGLETLKPENGSCFFALLTSWFVCKISLVLSDLNEFICPPPCPLKKQNPCKTLIHRSIAKWIVAPTGIEPVSKV